MRPLPRLYGPTPAAEFTPQTLKAIRHQLVQSGLSRGVANQSINLIRRIFKWGVPEGPIHVHVHAALATVEGLSGTTADHGIVLVRPV